MPGPNQTRREPTRQAAPESYITDVEQVGRWRWEASVFLVGADAPAHLVTLRAPTRRAALRRAARFVDLRERIAREL